MSKKQKIMLGRIFLTAALLIALHFVPVTGWGRFGRFENCGHALRTHCERRKFLKEALW